MALPSTTAAVPHRRLPVIVKQLCPFQIARTELYGGKIGKLNQTYSKRRFNETNTGSVGDRATSHCAWTLLFVSSLIIHEGLRYRSAHAVILPEELKSLRLYALSCATATSSPRSLRSHIKLFKARGVNRGHSIIHASCQTRHWQRRR